MIKPDHINGIFEGVGSLTLWANFLKLRRDKVVQGVHIFPVVFFTAWGVWNLIYYPLLGQLWSFIGGLSVVFANSAWIFLAAKYRGKQ